MKTCGIIERKKAVKRMIIPKYLKEGDTIGITAPSAGSGHDIPKLEYCLEKIRKEGYSVKETPNVRSNRLVSSGAKKRAAQLNDLVCDPKVDFILCAGGGDFLMEMLPHTDFDAFREHPKWLEGMSDPSTLLYIVPTKCDVATMYGINAGFFNVARNPKSLNANLAFWKGNLVPQKSYKKCQRDITADKFRPSYPDPVYWETPNGPVKTEGRMIGGCIDALRDIVGTPYDYTKDFVNRYKDDGIIWFFDVFAQSSEDFYHTLFQMKECGWFKYTKGVILGRVLFPRTSTTVTYTKALRKIFGRKMPLITEADIGHTSPAMVLINGGYAKIKAKDGKGSIVFTGE